MSVSIKNLKTSVKHMRNSRTNNGKKTKKKQLNKMEMIAVMMNEKQF